MELHARQTSVGDTAVLALDGEIDLATLPRLADALTRLTASGGPSVVDIDGVHVLDDAALGLVLGAAGRARRNGHDLVVVCTNTVLRERLAENGFDRAVRVLDRITAD